MFVRFLYVAFVGFVCLFVCFLHFRMFSKLRFLEICNVFLGFHKEFLVCLIFSWHVYNGFLDFQWYVACFSFVCLCFLCFRVHDYGSFVAFSSQS